MKKNNISLLFVLVVMLFSACTPQKKGLNRTLTVTIEPLRYFTEAIAGNRFRVQTMVPKGGNPETYEPTVQQMMQLSHSDLYIKVGSIGFEQTWMKKLEANAPHTIIVDSSEGIIPQESAHGIVDPHTWLSCQNALLMAQNIYKALVRIDKEDSLYFKTNLEQLTAQIRATNTRICESLTKDKCRSFLIYHPVLTYYAREYRLQQLYIEDEGREPSAAQLGKIIATAKSQGVRVLFVQREFANRNATIVARSIGAEIVDFNPLGYNWPEEMIKVAKSLK